MYRLNTAVVIVLVIHGLSYPSHSSGSAGLGTAPSADARNEGIPDSSEQMTIDAVIPAADIPLLDVGTAVDETGPGRCTTNRHGLAIQYWIDA